MNSCLNSYQEAQSSTGSHTRPTLAGVRKLIARKIGRRQLLEFIYRRPLSLADVGPVVSFSFDDFPRTAYSVGSCILKGLGVRGTFYTAPGLMALSNGYGNPLQPDDLHHLVADGHEIANHTFHHLSSRATELGAFIEDVRKGHASMRKIFGSAVSNNFAYPFGAVTAAAKKAVGNEMMSCRGIFEGVNGQVADLNLLRANSLYGDTDRIARVSRLLDDNERLKGWLIFYTHDVQESPSPHGCTPRLLESAVTSALERSMKVLTVDEVLQLAKHK